MKEKIVMIATLFLTGCMRINDPVDDTTSYYRPTNNREWTLKKRLEALGYEKVYFQVPMNRQFNYYQTYYLGMSTNHCITTLNIDSVVRFRDSLCKELYTNVIEDSVLVDLKKIFITIDSPGRKKCRDREYAGEEYDVEKLVKRYGFKVVKDGKGGYDRVPVK